MKLAAMQMAEKKVWALSPTLPTDGSIPACATPGADHGARLDARLSPTQLRHKRCSVADAVQLGSWVPVLFNLEADGRSKEEGVQIATSPANLRVEVQTVDANEEAGVDEMGTKLATR